MLYLVTCTVDRKEYMQDGIDEYSKIHIVEASSEYNACNAVESYYENESEYNSGTTYSVCVDDVSELIKGM